MTRPARYTAILLDMGGVLIDFGPAGGLPPGRLDWRGREALAAYLTAHGKRITPDDLEELLFAPWRAEYEHRVERGREADWTPHLERLRHKAGVRTRGDTLLGQWFRPYADQIEPLSGVPEALRELAARGFGLALVSNVPLPGKLYKDILARHGLLQHFDSVHFSYDDASRKPSPAMLRAALHALETPAHFALMVGDRKQIDIAAGRAAGIATAWVKSEYRTGPAADFDIASLADLPSRLR